MANLAEMVATIEDDLDRTDLTGQIAQAINDAINHYNAKTFWFSDAEASFNTIANQKSYGTADGLPVGIRSIYLAQATMNGVTYPLTAKTYKYVQSIDSGNFVGYPEFWAWFNNKLWLYPTPNDAYPITLSYRVTFTDLFNDQDSNPMTDEGYEMIMARARWQIYATKIKDAEQAAIAKAQEIDAFNSLMAKTEDLELTSGVEKSYF